MIGDEQIYRTNRIKICQKVSALVRSDAANALLGVRIILWEHNADQFFTLSTPSLSCGCAGLGFSSRRMWWGR